MKATARRGTNFARILFGALSVLTLTCIFHFTGLRGILWHNQPLVTRIERKDETFAIVRLWDGWRFYTTILRREGTNGWDDFVIGCGDLRIKSWSIAEDEHKNIVVNCSGKTVATLVVSSNVLSKADGQLQWAANHY
jgi:hypothetical protein